jgi:hypothetical protein
MLLLGLVSASACNLTDCTADLKPAVRVKIVDAATGGLVEAPSVTVTVTDGPYTDTVTLSVPPVGALFVYLAFERTGTYRVEVNAPGYSPWVEAEVRAVDRDECHVKTVDLTARLEKAAGS